MTGANGSASDGEEPKTLQAIRYSGKKLQLLDQRKLPHESIFLDIPNVEAAWHAIKDMVVRGAPAIAISAALALSVQLQTHSPFPSVTEALEHIHEQLDYLLTSRPTAVNLSDAATKLKKIADEAAKQDGASVQSVVTAVVTSAELMLQEDVETNKQIGRYGADAIVKVVSEQRYWEADRGVRVLTHCNTGSLATAAFGTALGVIRTLHADGNLAKAVCTETRPYNQGSRLTAFELVHDCIPATLIADSAAAYLEATGGIDAVVVGADRVVANGDTANKIGTYSLALASKHHGIPFFVAAPISSIDPNIQSGKDIVIEERDPAELTHALGGRGPQVAPNGIHVWNPAFDITTADVITGIITEEGVIWKKPGDKEIDVAGFLRTAADMDLAPKEPAGEAHIKATEKDFSTFRQLCEATTPLYVEAHPHLSEMLGGHYGDWSVTEVGDGNINYVFVVKGPKGTIVVKQALPYIRCVGESWPISTERINFEAVTLKEHFKVCPELVPEVYLHDPTMSVVAMRYLEPPHIVLRKGLIAGLPYPLLSDHMSTFLAHTLFGTSLLANSTTTFRAKVAKFCANVEMCRLTEQLVFTEPYMDHPHNRWTTPQLDADVAAIRKDSELKLAAAVLKRKFIESAEALLHADLHTGSIMATAESTKVIDPEFAFYGPMGFDIGAYLGNVLLAYFSQDGQAKGTNSRDGYKAWLIKHFEETWTLFEVKFRALWDESAAAHPEDEGAPIGDLYVAGAYTKEDVVAAQDAYMRQLLQDALGFAGAKMIRRIIGFAHVEDLESIEDPELRAKCERRALDFAKRLVKQRHTLSGIDAVVSWAMWMSLGSER